MKHRKPLLTLILTFLMVLMCAAAANAEEIISGSCGEEVTFTLDSNGTLTISGSGEMYYSGFVPWYDYLQDIREVNIESGVTSVDGYLFENCSNLTSVTISETVERIESVAFEGCDNLTSIEVSPDNEIFFSQDGVLFERFEEGLTLMLYPDGKTDTSYAVPENVVAIFGTLSNPNLTKIILPSSIQDFEAGAFIRCVNLTEIEVSPDNEVFFSENGVLFGRISDGTILICYPMGKTDTSYEIPDGVAAIYIGAFISCGIKEITIPNSVTEIYVLSLNGTYNLTDIYYQGTEDEWLSMWNNDIGYDESQVTVHYDNIPSKLRLMNIVEFDDVSENYKFSIELSAAGLELTDNSVVYVAVYDENGALCDLQTVAIDSTGKKQVFFYGGWGTTTVKAFAWDKTTVKPLCDSSVYSYYMFD